MPHMNMTPSEAIARSISHDQIVHIIDQQTVTSDLCAVCEDYAETQDADGNPLTEYWGTDESGNEWRVHVHGPRAQEPAMTDTIDTTAADIIESARIYGHGPTDTDADGDLYPSVQVEVDYIGCMGDLPRFILDEVESAIAKKFDLVGWSMDGLVTETGEVWTYIRPEA